MNGLPKIADLQGKKDLLLAKTLSYFSQEVGYFVYIGVELEFYLLDHKSRMSTEKEVKSFIDFLNDQFLDDEIYFTAEQEMGSSQIEIKSVFTGQLPVLCSFLSEIQEKIKDYAVKFSCSACFKSVLHQDDCFNSLQFNLSIHDKNGVNIFSNHHKMIEDINLAILKYVDESVIFCIKNQSDFVRFDIELNKKLHKQGKYVAPTKKSCGVNNRSCLIRYFKNDNGLDNKIEFRLPCAESDHVMIIIFLIFCTLKAIKSSITGSKEYIIYGNAFDSQYNLPEFVKNYEQAQKCFEDGEFYEFCNNLLAKNI